MKILVTGSAGFIAGYLVEELLAAGHEVVGLDNYSKYGPIERSYDTHPRYRSVVGDAKNADLLRELVADCDHFVAGAAIIGGISLFHELAYDLLAENERITAAAFDAAIWAHREGRLRKITVISSSMVYESASIYPTPEGEERRCPPPHSTYGFQKLATEFFAQGAHEQYKLPYTIVRPFNCVGIGERRARSDKEIMSGNVRLAMSHVVPDLAQKVVKGQDPLHILGDGRQVRHYTYGGDLARGIRLAIESPAATNNDFNLSTDQSTTVLELAELIWRKVRGNEPLRVVSDKPYPYDVQKRVPAVEKAKRMLGFEATTNLSDALDEIIPWIRKQIEIGGIEVNAMAGAPADVDFVIPVYNEGANIGRALAEIDTKVPISRRVIVVYDFEGDDTVPVVRELAPRYPGVELLRNEIGRGVLNAVRAGIAATTAEVVVITMADLSDDVGIVPKMVDLIRDGGYDIVCASRYMRGGRQIGGPRLKGFLSRAAGLSLYWLAGLPTHDATNAFRAYRRSVLEETAIESQGGFEYSLEITAKAYAAGRRITEIPSTWRDRSAGKSRFKLRAWLPQYLRWYFYTLTHRPAHRQ